MENVHRLLILLVGNWAVCLGIELNQKVAFEEIFTFCIIRCFYIKLQIFYVYACNLKKRVKLF